MSGKRKLLLGIFIVGGILLFCVGLFLIGSRQQLFSHHFKVYTDLPTMDTLQPGAMVRVAGMAAGQVTAIQVPNNPSAKFRLTLSVDEKFHPIVRTDSAASIETEGMVGSKYVEIAQGSPQSPECPPEGTLPGKQSANMGALMQKGSEIANSVQATIKDLHKNADQTLESFTSTARHVDGVIVSVRGNVEKVASNAAQMSADARQIANGLRQGQGAAGELLSNPQVAASLRKTIDNTEQTTAKAEQTSNNIDAITRDFEQKDLPDIHKTLDHTNDMTGQLNQAVGTFLAKGNSDVSTA